MYLGSFILSQFRNTVCQLFLRDLESKKRLDPTTFDLQFLNKFYLNTTVQYFHLSFRRGSDDFTSNQHEKYKRL